MEDPDQPWTTSFMLLPTEQACPLNLSGCVLSWECSVFSATSVPMLVSMQCCDVARMPSLEPSCNWCQDLESRELWVK